MATTQTQIAEIPSGSPVRPYGVLAKAYPAPEGWEAGGIEASQTCPTPIIRDKCITITPDEPTRPERIEFQAFMVEQGVTCSTVSGSDHELEARTALESSTDYALGITLLNGIANAGAPNLGDATDLGPFAGVLAAVAALECEAAAIASGQEYMLHASPGAAVYLKNAGLIDDDGRSPSGATWIISAGYSCPDDGSFRIWATGRVWAAAGPVTTYQDVNRRLNDREAWAARSLVVGFNTCILLSADFTPAAGGGSDVDPEARAQIETLQTEVATLQTSLDGKASAEHTHAAADVTSGAFVVARIPSLAISKTTGLQDALDGKVESVVAGTGIAVDAADPANPIVATA